MRPRFMLITLFYVTCEIDLLPFLFRSLPDDTVALEIDKREKKCLDRIVNLLVICLQGILFYSLLSSIIPTSPQKTFYSAKQN